jgi:hypothetical protein
MPVLTLQALRSFKLEYKKENGRWSCGVEDVKTAMKSVLVQKKMNVMQAASWFNLLKNSIRENIENREM